MALAAAKFVEGLLKGLKGEESVIYAYVASDACKGLDYFSTPLKVGVSFSFGTLSVPLYQVRIVFSAFSFLRPHLFLTSLHLLPPPSPFRSSSFFITTF